MKNSKTCVKQPLSKRPKMFSKIDYRLMQVKSTCIAECSKESILQYFRPSLSYQFTLLKTFVLSFFECPFYTGVTVVVMLDMATNAAPSLHIPVGSNFLFRNFESKI